MSKALLTALAEVGFQGGTPPSGDEPWCFAFNSTIRFRLSNYGTTAGVTFKYAVYQPDGTGALVLVDGPTAFDPTSTVSIDLAIDEPNPCAYFVLVITRLESGVPDKVIASAEFKICTDCTP